MENSKQRLQQKSLWQAVNLLSQPPCAYSLHPHPQAKPPGPLTAEGCRPTGYKRAQVGWLHDLDFFLCICGLEQ